MSSYIDKANEILDKTNKINNNISTLKDKYNSNFSNLKNIKKLFSEKFSSLVEEIEKIPEDKLKVIEEEVSPASIVNLIHWEWLYTSKSTREFIKDENDLYSSSGSGTLNAYSSHAVNENFTWKVRFHNTQSFGCGGFGIISKNDPQFETNAFGNFGGHPLSCLCCNGAWSASSMTLKGGQALQHSLKSSNDKVLTFEVNYDENVFKIYNPDGVLHSEYSLNNLTYKDDLVLFYYSGSSTNHSHEILIE